LKYGLIKKANSGHTAFGKGCLVFPLKNKDGQIVGMYFRETDDNGKSQTITTICKTVRGFILAIWQKKPRS
jgi:tRNA 2-selenouridine synthase SelU